MTLPRISGHRWLWGALCVLLLGLLGTLVFLTRAYEENRAIVQLEQNAASIASEIRSGLQRNLQDLQALPYGSNEPDLAWTNASSALLSRHRELMRLEWRNSAWHVLRAERSPYLPQLFEHLPRDSVEEVRQACQNARRYNGPAYSPSYFWPTAEGQGQELLEMCMPLRLPNGTTAYVVATYGLSGLLSELIRPDTRRGRSVALTEADGTRLSILGSAVGRDGLIHANALLDLPGVAFMLRVDRARDAGSWLPTVLSVTVLALTLALAALLGLLDVDIRKRQRAEGGLAEALAFRKAMEDSLVTGLCARDMDERITYVNPAFCEMVGRSAQELIGTAVPAPYWPAEFAQTYQLRHADRMNHAAPRSDGIEAEYERPDGTRFPVLIFEAPLRDAQGHQTGWMSAVLDMSEQRRIEEMSRATRERLQASARLAIAGEMASLISHELNQPLAAIASYASGSINLLQGPPDAVQRALPDVQEAIGRIAHQAERAGKVIKSVSDLVRRRDRARGATTVQALFDGIAPLLELQARKWNVDIVHDIAPDCPAVWCDATMVEQALLNLARNGLQAMTQPPAASTAPKTLTLGARLVPATDTATQPRVELSVTDLGHGMTPEVTQQLLTPFFTTKPEGMGLGLSLCRTVAEQHGGALAFEPAQPCGTVFRFTLPVARTL